MSILPILTEECLEPGTSPGTSWSPPWRRINYDGPVVIETFNHNVEEIATAAGFWRAIVPDPEQSATEGLQFLKEKFGQS